MSQPLTIATWNVRQGNPPENVVGYLKQSAWDIACLQEVRPNLAEELDRHPDWTVVNWRSMITDEPLGKRPHGAVIVLRGGWQVETAELLRNDPWAGRGVVARVGLDGTSLTIVSWHAPHGAGNRRKGESDDVARRRKMDGYVALGACLDAIEGPTVLGFDGNHWNLRSELVPEPAPDPETDGFYEQHLFFSAGARHRLKDTLIAYLASHPKEYEAFQRERPDGPLTVTHRRGGRGPLDRFDYLMASEDLEVLSAATDYDTQGGTGPAGSDHGFVSVELRLLLKSNGDSSRSSG